MFGIMGRRSRLWTCIYLVQIIASPGNSLTSLGSSEVCEPSKVFAQPVTLECSGFGNIPHLDWQAFSGELYDARADVFRFGANACRDRLVTLLSLSVSKPHIAFECPFAAASVAYALAEVGSAVGDVDDSSQSKRRWGLLLLHLALSLLPLGGERRSCSQWPVHGREVAAAFLHSVSALRLEVEATMSVPPYLGTFQLSGTLPRVAVATACAGNHDPTRIAFSAKNRRSYAHFHGYDLHFYSSAADIITDVARESSDEKVNFTTSSIRPFWRAQAVRAVMNHRRNYEWVIWLDCDVVVTDLSRSVPSLLSSYAFDTNNVALLAPADGRGVLPEFFLLRQSTFSSAFLDRWLRMPWLPRSSRPVLGRRTQPPPTWSLQNLLGERSAFRQSMSPHWGAWLGDVHGVNWNSAQWPREVQLSQPVDGRRGFGALLAPGELSKAEEGLPNTLARPWAKGDFAWYSRSCSQNVRSRGDFSDCARSWSRAQAMID